MHPNEGQVAMHRHLLQTPQHQMIEAPEMLQAREQPPNGRTLPGLAVFAPEGTSPLPGAVVWETFGLAVDPVARRLVPTPGLLLRSG